MPLSRRSFDNNNTGNTGARGKPHKRGLTPKRKSTPTWREREAAFAMEEYMQGLVVDGGSGGVIGDVSDLGMDAAMLLPWGRGIKGAGKIGKALGKALGIGKLPKTLPPNLTKTYGKIMGGAELPARRIRPKFSADDLVAAKKADPTGYRNSRAWQTKPTSPPTTSQIQKIEEALANNPEFRSVWAAKMSKGTNVGGPNPKWDFLDLLENNPTFRGRAAWNIAGRTNPRKALPKALKAGSAGQRSRSLPMQAEKMSGNRFGSRWDTADDLADRLAGTALPRDAGARFAQGVGNAATDPLYNLRWAVFDDMLANTRASSKTAADWVKRADFDMLQQYLGR